MPPKQKSASATAPQKKQKLWGGRFDGATDAQMDAFNSSLGFDHKLYAVDIQGSRAYAKALHLAGMLTKEEWGKLDEGLLAVLKEWESGHIDILEGGDEDVHSLNERRLTELIGSDIAGKLHTGRSRNDQVATDVRLWIRQESVHIANSLKNLITALVQRAKADLDALMPGYTHLQRAQPIRWSHLLLSYACFLQADFHRLESLLLHDEAATQLCPLGSGALAGNPFAIDRHQLATELGFSNITPNSLYGVSDRDFIADFLYNGTMIMTHLSRISEDLIIYSSQEFGFVQLSDAYSTGSSLMPQKKNPDSLELLRGKSGRVFGQLSGFLMTYKGLASTYNKDLQEDKEPLFDCAHTLKQCLAISVGVISTLKINQEKMRAALSADMLATDIAEYLVRKGVPFRSAHHISGRVIRLAEDKYASQGPDQPKYPVSHFLRTLSLDEWKSIDENFEEDIAVTSWWDFERSVESRCVPGGTAKSSVSNQIKNLESWIKSKNN